MKMFLIIFSVFLSLTAKHSLADTMPSACTEVLKVSKRRSESYTFKGNDNVVCIRSENERHRIRLTIYDERNYDKRFPPEKRFPRLFPEVQYVDGCKNVTSNNDWNFVSYWSISSTNCVMMRLAKPTEGKGATISYSIGHREYLGDFPYPGVSGRHKLRRTQSKPRSTQRKPRPTRKATPTMTAKEKKERKLREDCKSVEFRKRRGFIKSPGYPEKYITNLDCTYKITLPDPAERIQLIFRHLNLDKKSDDGECRDYIEVYDGFSTWSSKMHKFCDGFVNKPIISAENKLKIKFVSDGTSGEGMSFDVTYDPYQIPRATDVTQKVTGVVIGTACGLVFLVLTFLAICHSRRLTLLHRVQGNYDVTSTDGTDVIQEKAPPSYEDVLASPEKYPLSPSSKHKTIHCTKARNSEYSDKDDLPSYFGLFPTTMTGDETGDSTRIEPAQSENRNHEGDEEQPSVREIETDMSDGADVAGNNVTSDDVIDDITSDDIISDDIISDDITSDDITSDDIISDDIISDDINGDVSGDDVTNDCASAGDSRVLGESDVEKIGTAKDEHLTYSRPISTDV